jgi:hypothetical protein
MSERIGDAVPSAASGNAGEPKTKKARNLRRLGDVKRGRDNHDEGPEGQPNANQQGESPPRQRQRQPDNFTPSKVIVHSVVITFCMPRFRIKHAGTCPDIIQDIVHDGIQMEAKRRVGSRGMSNGNIRGNLPKAPSILAGAQDTAKQQGTKTS